MLQTPFLVQVLIPKHGASQIDKMMTTLKESSKWISTNKRNSAERLSDVDIGLVESPVNGNWLARITKLGAENKLFTI